MNQDQITMIRLSALRTQHEIAVHKMIDAVNDVNELKMEIRELENA